MERIKAALEKAKKERPESKKNQRSSGKVIPGQAGESLEKDREAIEYKQTKVVKLNLDHLSNNRIIAYNKSSQHSASFDLLRTQVLRIMEENNWKTLAITSPVPEAGKTVVSINLAMSMAHQTDQTVMLVDFDLRRPKVLKYLGVDVDVSFNDVLDDNVLISDALINPDMPHLTILPVKQPVEKASEVLASKKIGNLVKDLKNRYDDRIVIFDLPPILNLDDTLAILPEIDCVLLVVANGMATKKEISESVQQLGNVNLLGYVLNKADEEIKRYYYGSE